MPAKTVTRKLRQLRHTIRQLELAGGGERNLEMRREFNALLGQHLAGGADQSLQGGGWNPFTWCFGATAATGGEDEAPVKTTTDEAPVKTTTDEAPVKTTTDEAPVKTTTDEDVVVKLVRLVQAAKDKTKSKPQITNKSVVINVTGTLRDELLKGSTESKVLTRENVNTSQMDAFIHDEINVTVNILSQDKEGDLETKDSANIKNTPEYETCKGSGEDFDTIWSIGGSSSQQLKGSENIEAGAMKRRDKRTGTIFDYEEDIKTLVGKEKGRILLINAIGYGVADGKDFATVTKDQATDVKEDTALAKLKGQLERIESPVEFVIASRTRLPGLDASHMRQSMNDKSGVSDLGGIEISSGQIVYKQDVNSKEYILKKVKGDPEKGKVASPLPETLYANLIEPSRA